MSLSCIIVNITQLIISLVSFMHGHSDSIHSEMKRDSRSLLRQKPRADMEVG